MIPVLYEDSAAAGRVKAFGPHQLALNCLYARIGRRYGLESAFDHRPRRGVNKLLSDLKLDLGPDIVAVLDGDHLAEALNLPANTPVVQLETRVRSLYARGTAHVCVLDRNLETVVRVLRDCLKDPPESRQTFDEALAKNLNARDLVLTKTTRTARDCLQSAMGSFAKFIDTLYQLVP